MYDCTLLKMHITFSLSLPLSLSPLSRSPSSPLALSLALSLIQEVRSYTEFLRDDGQAGATVLLSVIIQKLLMKLAQDFDPRSVFQHSNLNGAK